MKTKFGEKIRKERKGKTECHRLRYSWEDWEEKDSAIPVCPVVGIHVYFYKRRELKELCPWICIDPAVTGGTLLQSRGMKKWSLTQSGCAPALTSASWAMWNTVGLLLLCCVWKSQLFCRDTCVFRSSWGGNFIHWNSHFHRDFFSLPLINILSSTWQKGLVYLSAEFLSRKKPFPAML